MKKIDEILAGVNTLAIAGHVHPDGDCVGSTAGLYSYLKENYPEISADLYLESVKEDFDFFPNLTEVRNQVPSEAHYDLVVLLDVSSPDRIGVLGEAYAALGDRTVCIDHHVTNKGFCDENIVAPRASSACEVLFELLEEEKISTATANCLYTGIMTDTGVFQYDCTSERTMQIAGKLMSKGVAFTGIIERVFFTRTWKQNKAMAEVLSRAELYLDGQVAVGVAGKPYMDANGLVSADLDGIVNQLKNTAGVHLAIFLYEKADGEFKVSLRSDDKVNSALLASHFGGGGHIKASGCTLSGEPEALIRLLLAEAARQL